MMTARQLRDNLNNLIANGHGNAMVFIDAGRDEVYELGGGALASTAKPGERLLLLQAKKNGKVEVRMAGKLQ